MGSEMCIRDRITCSRAFGEWAGIDPLSATLADLAAAGRRAGLEPVPEMDRDAPDQQWDRWFERLLAEVITPRLGHERPTMLEAWPVSQAAFARIDPDDPRAARRFELFFTGVELANGWRKRPVAATLYQHQSTDCRQSTAFTLREIGAFGQATSSRSAPT